MTSIAKALGVDAGELVAPVDPVPAAGDLQAEIAGFTTVDACVAARAHLDPLLGDALEAIGYDTFVRDACRVLDAAHAKDARKCEDIDASSLRRQCTSVVAAIAGDADGCPWMVPSRPEAGREPWCLAMAARDPRLCAGAETASDRVTCEATVRHDATPCATLPLDSARARCRRDADRWHAATPGPDGSLAALPAVTGALSLDASDAGSTDATFLADLGRGLVLLDQRDGVRFTLGIPGGPGGSFIAASPHTSARISVELFASPDGKRVAVERAEISLPGKPMLATPLARSTLVARIDHLDKTRGGSVTLTLDGDLSDSTGAAHVHATATTFVRDVVSAKALYGAGIRFGDAGVMR